MDGEIYGPSDPLAAMRRLLIADVIEATAQVHQTSRRELVGPSRARWLTAMRQQAMFVARHSARQSYPKIGRAFGGRDPSTVIHADRAISAAIGESRWVAGKVSAIELRAQALVEERVARMWRRLSRDSTRCSYANLA